MQITSEYLVTFQTTHKFHANSEAPFLFQFGIGTYCKALKVRVKILKNIFHRDNVADGNRILP